MSKLTFIGTASAIGFPHMFCDCEVCKKMIALGGKNVRARSSIALGDKYRVDFSSDCYMKFLENKIPLYNMEHIFFTHSHLDHVDANQIMLRYPKYNKTSPLKPLKIYGNQSVLERFHHDEKRQERIEKTKLEFQKVIPYKKIEADELQCWPIIVDHDNREECFNYIFKYRGKNIYIGYDQKSMPEESFEFLSDFKLDIAVFEGTLGDSEPAGTHMTFAEMAQLKDSLASGGSITPETKCYATHFSHHMKYTHEQLEKRLEPEEIIPAYDGLTIDI